MPASVKMSSSADGSHRPPRRPLAIGQWLVDPHSNELRRGSEMVRLEPMAMDVLMLLAERAGRPVTRDELFTAAWPASVTFEPAPGAAMPGRASTAAATPSSPTARKHARAIALIVLVATAIAIAAGYFALPPSNTMTSRESFDADAFRQPGWVGVAPFESLGGDPEQAYLARGITVSLVTDLSRLSDLRVIRLPDRATANREVPGVHYRVTGSVQRDAGRLRVTVHLVDAQNGEELWSERFDRPFVDILAMQDEITAKVVQLLPAKVSDVERLRSARRHTQSVDAYDYFLRAQALLLVRSVDANDRARTLYRSALELDPKFARAYAGLAMTYAMDYRLRDSARASLDRAFELARTAREIDPDIPEVHWAMGFVQAQARQHDDAIRSLQQAIVLDRSFADGYALLGGIHTYTGRPARSIELVRTALRLNPDAGYLYFLVLGRALLFQNDPEQALIHLRAAAMRNPADVETRVFTAAALVAAGDRAGAKWEADEIRTLEPAFATGRWLDSHPMTSAAQQAQLITLLADAGL